MTRPLSACCEPWSTWSSRGGIARRLQPYTAPVPPPVRRALVDAGAVRFIREGDFGEQFAVLVNLDLYSPDLGLTWEDPTFRTAEGLIF